jgi:hypothetical protein
MHDRVASYDDGDLEAPHVSYQVHGLLRLVPALDHGDGLAEEDHLCFQIDELTKLASVETPLVPAPAVADSIDPELVADGLVSFSVRRCISSVVVNESERKNEQRLTSSTP